MKTLELYRSKPLILKKEYCEEVGTGLDLTFGPYTLMSRENRRRNAKIWHDSNPLRTNASIANGQSVTLIKHAIYNHIQALPLSMKRHETSGYTLTLTDLKYLAEACFIGLRYTPADEGDRPDKLAIQDQHDART
ncbi:hypothetical protein EDB86DRAFT_3141284 [Lactarius hatsudake]|nr:hypothetical protein EDB86DRAFT_3141284 [Lactarius hatsudake]